MLIGLSTLLLKPVYFSYCCNYHYYYDFYYDYHNLHHHALSLLTDKTSK